jgi:hypothetical protein
MIDNTAVLKLNPVHNQIGAVGHVATADDVIQSKPSIMFVLASAD